MKTPRITDFDPNAKTPKLKSSLDNMPPIQKPETIDYVPRQNTSTITHDHPQPKPNTNNPQATLQSPKRPYVRRTFDFYEDQIVYLTRQSLEARLAGNEKSMNEMVREALDDWIKKRTSGK